MLPPSTLLAPAKLNVTLNILGKRDDGFHEIISVMVKLALADELTLAIKPDEEPGLYFTCSCPILSQLPLEQQLVYRAFDGFWQWLEAKPPAAFHLHLEKQIPMQAGLGGGSSDAAAMLRLLNRFQVSEGRRALPEAALMQLAASLGSDVPFFLLDSQVGLSVGRGELVRQLPTKFSENLKLVIAKPKLAIATPWAYQQVAAQKAYKAKPLAYKMPTELGLTELQSLSFNDFEPVLYSQLPELQGLKEKLEALGAAKTLLCGSGSAIAGFWKADNCPDEAALAQALGKQFWYSLTSFL